MAIGHDVVKVTIDEAGNLSFVDDAPLAELNTAGVCRRTRLSHIEPHRPILRWLFRACRSVGLVEFTRHWPCHWRVDMRPVGGPIITMPTNASRREALNTERNWLWINHHV
jgi:hypothetical protein